MIIWHRIKRLFLFGSRSPLSANYDLLFCLCLGGAALVSFSLDYQPSIGFWKNQNTWDYISFYYLGHGDWGHIERNLKETALFSFVIYIGRCISLSSSKYHLMAQSTCYIALTVALIYLMPNEGRAGGLSSLNNVLFAFGVTVIVGYFAIAISRKIMSKTYIRRLIGVSIGSFASVAIFAGAEGGFSNLSAESGKYIAAWGHLIGFSAGLAFAWVELMRANQTQAIDAGVAQFLDLFSDRNLHRHSTHE